MTTDTTHITKEGLLQALKEHMQEIDSYGDEKMHAAILARAAELSAQESKPVAQMICPRCEADRFKEPCPRNDLNCPMIGTPTTATPVSAQDASPKDGWQPIETAPKDDTRVLILDHGIQFIAKWSNEADHGYAMVAPGWQIHYCHEDLWYCTATATPTHWMPLPEPPK